MRNLSRVALFLSPLLLLGPLLLSPAQDTQPSIAAQLKSSKVVPGTALERLIRTNQDFKAFAADAPGKGDIPGWLKVYYRKHHPKKEIRPKDPTLGYPLALENLYTWMLTHQDLQPPPATAASKPVLSRSTGTNRRISGEHAAPRSESDIRVNFLNPDLIIGGSNNPAGDGSQAQFYSSDGGASWGQTSLPLVAGDQLHSDPTVDWTSEGTAWATTMGIQGGVLRVRAYKSTDHGVTWTHDGVISGTQTDTDKQMMWVDHSATSPHRDNIYVVWHNGPEAFINHRTGLAGSWQTPKKLSGAETTGTAIGSDVTSNADGAVFAMWPDTGSQKLFVVKSTDGGGTYSKPLEFASTFRSFEISIPAFARRKMLIYVSVGAYRNKDKDKDLVYATWCDLTGDTDCKTAADQPGDDVMSDCKSRVWFSRSKDGGKTWEKKVMINNQASRNDQFNQRLAVDESNGTLVVTYNDTVRDAGRKKSDIWYQSSADDGVTWTKAERVSTQATDETAQDADLGNQYGDYNGLSGHGGRFFTCWTDRRSGGFEEIWAAPIVIGSLSLHNVPSGVQAAAARLSSASDDELGKIRWSRVTRLAESGGEVSPRSLYQLLGTDEKGYACEMLVDGRWGGELEFRRVLPLSEAKLPAAVGKALETVKTDHPKLQPTEVEVISVGRKISAFGFRGPPAKGAPEDADRPVVYVGVDGKPLVPKKND